MEEVDSLVHPFDSVPHVGASEGFCEGMNLSDWLLLNSDFLEYEAQQLGWSADTSCLTLAILSFSSHFTFCTALDRWTDSMTRVPYAIDPDLLDY
jgi:hypothetical protein